jgi:hypothetical protein
MRRPSGVPRLPLLPSPPVVLQDGMLDESTESTIQRWVVPNARSALTWIKEEGIYLIMMPSLCPSLPFLETLDADESSRIPSLVNRGTLDEPRRRTSTPTAACRMRGPSECFVRRGYVLYGTCTGERGVPIPAWVSIRHIRYGTGRYDSKLES